MFTEHTQTGDAVVEHAVQRPSSDCCVLTSFCDKIVVRLQNHHSGFHIIKKKVSHLSSEAENEQDPHQDNSPQPFSGRLGL